ncbi:MAG: T9SS type A sorting domain-containing protein [Ignavibacteria bacterium]|nr:T9SS type A sorting domain-containing protein [Ignavibacteria bacterium]
MKKLILLNLAFLFFATTFSSNPPGWYVQTLPVNDLVNDIFFLDSLNGWIVTQGDNNPVDTSYIMSTTNGGNNWIIQMSQPQNLNVIQFLDINTGYAAGGTGSGFARMYKTSNSGLQWQLVSSTGMSQINDMFFVNKDTGWVCDPSVIFGGLYKTINGSANWVQQLDESYKIQNIFFLNKDTGWASGRYDGISSKVFRTTNGGNNWNLQNTFTQQLNDIYFFNEFVGIISSGFSYKTTDGGFNWVLTNDGGIELSFGSDSVGWAGNNFTTIIKTTTAGSSWYRQTTNMSNPSVSAFDSLTAWAGGSRTIHTTNGGLTTIESSSEIPNNFLLNQNFPNPFNPSTVIRYSIKENRIVNLIVYNALGKKVTTLVNEKQYTGSYEVEFDGSGLPGGVYFYRLSTGNFNETKKMILIK